MIKISDGNAFKLRVTAMVNSMPADLSVVTNMIVNFVRRGRLAQPHGIDSNGKLVISNDGSLARGIYGVEITGYHDGKPWRHYIKDAFKIVDENEDADTPSAVDDVPIYDLEDNMSFGGDGVTAAYVDAAIDAHNEDGEAHEALQTAMAGKVDDVLVDGESVVETDPVTGKRTVGFRKNQFGKVDDVKVNGESVLNENNEAEITVPTKTSELDNDEDYVDESGMQAALAEKQDVITSVVEPTVVENGGQPSASVLFHDGQLEFAFQNLKGERGNGIASVTEETSSEDGGINTHTIHYTDPNVPDSIIHTRNGSQGRPGADFQPIEDVSGLSIAHNLGNDETKVMSQKAVMEAVVINQFRLADATEKQKADRYIDTNGKWAQSQGGTNCGFFPVRANTFVKITASDSGSCIYAFLTSTDDSASIGDTASFARGWAGRKNIGNSATVIEEVPSDAKWLYYSRLYTSTDVTPKAFLLNVASETSTTGLTDKKINTVDAVVDFYIPSSGALSGLWKTGNKTSLIAIVGGKSYKIIPKGNYPLTYTFLTDKTGIANNATPHYAADCGRRDSYRNTEYTYMEAPQDAQYLAVMTEYSGSAREIGKLVELIPLSDVLNEALSISFPSKIIRERLQRVPIYNQNGGYGTGSYARTYSTAKMYKVPNGGIVKLSFSSFSGTVSIYGYDRNKKYIDYVTSLSQSVGVPMTVEMKKNWSYIKVGITVNKIEGADNYPDIVDMVIEGNFATDAVGYNVPQVSADANGNYMIPLTMSIDAPTPTSQDIETATITDVVNIQFDHGILALPSTYTDEGEPTRLIIFCHGSAKHILPNTQVFPSGAYGIDPTYWLSEGYAVMDMDGLPNDTTTPHWCVPVAYQCYLAAYRFVVNNYNIHKEVFLGGRSLGGGMALTIMAKGNIPVVACCPFAPPGPYSALSFYTKTAEEKQMIADACGIYNPNNVAWEANDFNKEVLMMEYATINGNEKYIGNFGRLMQFSPSYILAVNNPSPSVLTDDRVFVNGKSYIQEIYGSISVKTGTPVKFFGAYDDATCPPWTLNLWTQMFRNGGCICEQRMFPTGNHPFDLADANLVSEYVNSKGMLLYNVPIAYIEALQFWRRYE